MALVGEAHIIVRAITNQVQKDIEKAFSNVNNTASRAGGDAASSFSDGFTRKMGGNNVFTRLSREIQSIVPNAQQARAAFQSMVRTGYTLTTGLSVLVGGISSVIGGLGALVGAAGAAGASLAVVGNAVFALGAGMIASKLALGGVGKAVAALNKQSRAATGGGTSASTTRAVEAARDAQIAAAERVADAEESLSRTIERNRGRLVDANEAVEEAQRALNRALKEGREEIQQIGFESEDAALAEQEAALELSKAREALARVQDLPPNNRARQAAELAFKQAELNYRKAQDKAADLAAEQDRLARTGVRGTDVYINAAEKLADAEEDRTKAVKDALEDEADARKALARAQADQVDAAERVAEVESPGFNAPVGGAAWDEGLNDAQRKFALFIAGLKPQFDELKRIAAEAFLPRLQTAIETLMEKAYPVVATGIGIVATAMGEAAISIANAITGAKALADLTTVFESSGRLIETMGSAIGKMWRIAMTLMAAAAPQAERFFSFVDDRFGQFADYLDEFSQNDGLKNWFAVSGDMMAKFGDIFGNIFGGFGAIIQANFGPGTGGWQLITWLQEATQKFADLGNTPEKMGKLKDYFLGVSDNTKAISQSIGELIGGLIALGDNPAIGQTFAALERGAPFLVSIVEKSIEAGPVLGELVAKIVEIIDTLTDNGAIEIFFGTLLTIATAVGDFLANDTVKSIMDVTGRVFAFLSAMGLVFGVGKFAFEAVAGMVANTAGNIGKLVGGFGTLSSAIGAVRTNGLGGGLATLRDGFKKTGSDKDDLIANLGLFDNKLKETGGVAGAMPKAMSPMRKMFNEIGSTITVGAVGALGGLGNIIGKVGAGFATFGRAILPMLGPIGIVIGIIATLAGMFYALYQTNEEFRTAIDDAWAEISKALEDAGKQIMEALQPLIVAFGEIMQAVIPLVTTIIGQLVPAFVKIVSAIVPIVTMIVSALVPVITTLVGALVPIVTMIITLLVPAIEVLVTVLGFIITIIVEVLKVVITVFTAIITFIIDVVSDIIAGILNFITNFESNWNSFWGGVFTIVSDIWNAIAGAIDAAWKWIDTYIFGPIRAAVQWVADAFKIAGDAMAAAWQWVLDALTVVWNWINDYIFTPIVNAVNWVSDMFKIAGILMALAWQEMQKSLDAVFKWIDKFIFKPIRDAVQWVSDAFSNTGKAIAWAWEEMQRALHVVFKWIDDNVFAPIRSAVDLVQQAFENVAAGIATAWDGIKKAAAAPINFVIDTVYNNGLRSFWNDLAGTLGMNDLKLPPAKTVAFASGGVMPGYSPGKDIHKFWSPTGGYLHLSGGEAIMRPEWTRAVGGPAAVERMNRAARRGQKFATGGVFNSPRVQRFASGGTTNFAEDILSNIGKFAEIVGDFFTNPIDAIQKHVIEGLIKPLMAQGDDNVFTKLVGGVPVKIASWLGESITKIFNQDGSDKPANALGWERMWGIVKAQFPKATLNSAYNDRKGGPTYHGKGRAIDVNPSMEIFNWLRNAFPNSRELIYSPANNRQLMNGKNFLWGEPVRSAHFNHVHWAMAKGGTVLPSPGGTSVQVAEAGRAERIEPLDRDGLSVRDRAIIDRLAGPENAGGNTFNIYQLPGEDPEALAQRVSEIVMKNSRRGGI